MARLVSYVHVFDDEGEPHAFGPDDDVPEWAAAKMGPHCFETDADAVEGVEPPRAGKGSGRDAWAEFASTKGVDVEADASRDEIIAQLADAGYVEA